MKVFHLPTAVLAPYEDVGLPGDEGWPPDELEASIAREGLKTPLEVGRSRTHRAQGDDRVFTFNGNHRLMIAIRAGLREAPCKNSSAEDAEPLTEEDVRGLGGRL